MVPTLLHKDAYLFILRLSDVMDDTVAFSKAIWSELLERDATEATMLRFATHIKAAKVLLSLLAPAKRTTFLTKEELELLRPAFVPATAPAAPAAATAEGEAPAPAPVPAPAAPAASDEMVPTSKKDTELRRQELLAPLKDALVQLGRAHAHELLCSAEGSFVLYEVATRWRDPALLEAVAVAAASDGVAAEDEEKEEEDEEGEAAADVKKEEVEEEEAQAMEEGDGEEEEVEGAVKPAKVEEGRQAPASPVVEGEDAGPLREHRIAYRTMKRLLLFEAVGPKGGKEGGEPPLPQPLFAEALYRQATGVWLKWLGSMRGGFVVEAIVKVPRVGPQVLAELRPHEQELAVLATENNLKGAAAVLEAMRGGGASSSPQGKGKGKPGKANKGAAAATAGAKKGKGGAGKKK